MAKSTTSTEAKTKTTKRKPVAKVAAKTTRTTAAKAKKPPIKTTKPVAVSSKPARQARANRLAFLRRGNTRLAALYAVLAIAAGFLMNTASAQLFLGHLAKDDLESRYGTVLAPAARVLYEVEFRWLLVALLAAAAVIALLRATKYRAVEQAGIANRVQPLRWVEFAITGALAFEIVALLNGLQDTAALKLSLASIALAALFAWMFERENAVTGKPARTSYIASAVAVVLPVLVLLATMVATYVYGMERSPWYAYAAAGVVSLGLLITVRSVWNNSRAGKAADYARTDRRYNLIAAGTKILLALILIVGLYSK